MNVGHAGDRARLACEPVEDLDVMPPHVNASFGHHAEVAPKALGQRTPHVRGQAERAEVDDRSAHQTRCLVASGRRSNTNDVSAPCKLTGHWSATRSHGHCAAGSSVSRISLSVPASTAIARR
jgi:hypothetical protein